MVVSLTTAKFKPLELSFMLRPTVSRPVFYICCWPLPAQSFFGPSPWDSRPYFTVSDLRLPFSSPPTTRRVTVEVFDPVSTRVLSLLNYQSSLYSPITDRTENVSSIIARSLVAGETCPQSCSLATAVVLSPVYTAVTWK
jgi:hypothetical protein